MLSLLPDCVLPGCHNPVAEVGEPCPECRRAFGTKLRENGPRLTAEEITERDHGVRAAYALQRATVREKAPYGCRSGEPVDLEMGA